MVSCEMEGTGKEKAFKQTKCICLSNKDNLET